jgi:hypothetical protein
MYAMRSSETTPRNISGDDNFPSPYNCSRVRPHECADVRTMGMKSGDEVATLVGIHHVRCAVHFSLQQYRQDSAQDDCLSVICAQVKN